MIYAMVKIDKKSKQRQLMWHVNSEEHNLKEEAIAALEYSDDEVIIDGDDVTGKKFHISYELCG